MRALALVAAFAAAVLPARGVAQNLSPAQPLACMVKGVAATFPVVELCEGQVCYLRCSGNQRITAGTLTVSGAITGGANSSFTGPLIITGNAQLRGINGATGSAIDLSTGIAQMTTGAGAAGVLCTNATAICAVTGSANVSSGIYYFSGVTNGAYLQSTAVSNLTLGTSNAPRFAITDSSVTSSTMGSGGNAVSVGGTASVTTADVTSSGASNLISYTLPANALTTTNRCLRIKGWGTALNNANAKTVALDFGSQTIITKQLNPSIANTTWSFQAIVCRSGSNTQDIYAEAWNPMGTTVSSVDGATVLYQAARTAGTQTETATITIKGKTTVATTTDVTMDGLAVEYF